MLRFAVIVALAIATPTLTPVLAADPATKQASAPVAPTATFVAQAAFGNMFEIESSKLALERSKAGPVKAFAQRMVDDHSAAAVKFKEAVLEAKLAMPPDKLDAKHRRSSTNSPASKAATSTRPTSRRSTRPTSRPWTCSRATPKAARIRGCARSRPSCCPPCRRISSTSPRCAEGLAAEWPAVAGYRRCSLTGTGLLPS